MGTISKKLCYNASKRSDIVNKKSLSIISAILTSSSILFTILFIWTLNVKITYTQSNSSVTRIVDTPEEFQIIWAILAIICLVLGLLLKIISILKEDKVSTTD